MAGIDRPAASSCFRFFVSSWKQGKLQLERMWVASRLSESQRPILEEGELEFLLQDGITLAFERYF